MASGKKLLVVTATALISQPIGMSIIIPISAITTTERHWQVSDAYNGGTDMHMQVDIKTTAITVRIFNGSTQQTLTAVNFYVL